MPTEHRGLLMMVDYIVKFEELLRIAAGFSLGLFTRAICVAIFCILSHAVEWLNHKSIDLYSFVQMD